MKDTIKILWIDDKHEKQTRIVKAAKKLGLELDPGRSPESVKRLKENYWEYSAVLLDVNILKTENSSENPSQFNGDTAIKKIKEIEEKNFPIVIYSGVSATLDGDDSFRSYNSEYEIFDKHDEAGYIKCLTTLKQLAENQPEFQIKTKNKDFFNIPNDIIPEKCKRQILTVLLEKTTDYKGYLEGLRKVLEKGVFPALKNNELMPDVEGLSKCSRFMSGQVVDNYELNELLPEKINHLFKFLIKDFTNPGAHSFKFSENNKNLIKGLCYLTIDLCVWVHHYVLTSKKTNWKQLSGQGKITRKLEDKGFVKSENFKEGIVFYKSDCKDWSDLKENDPVKISVQTTSIDPKNGKNRYKALVKKK